MWTVLDVIGDVLFALSGIAGAVFVGLYVGRSKWHETATGRTTVGVIGIIVTIILIAVGLDYADSDGPTIDHIVSILRVLLFGGLFVGFTRYIIILLRAQRKDGESPVPCEGVEDEKEV